MKNASLVIALAVGIVIGVAVDRMVGGSGSNPRQMLAARPAAVPAANAPSAEDPHAVYRVPLDGSPVRGPADALVTIVVASDFQCPFCKRVEPTLTALSAAFPGKLRVAWKHDPLPFHAKAIPAAVVAEEARVQGGDAKFWAMHDKLFEMQPALDRPQLETAAKEVGLDVSSVRAALDQGKHMDRIRSDQALCQSLGANGTPTLFINGRKVVGALPFETLKPIVEEELHKAEALVTSGVPVRDVYAKIEEKGARSVVRLPGGAHPEGAAMAPAAPATAAARIPLRNDESPREGTKVTIALFSDFQCPYCARVEPTLQQVRQAFPGNVEVVFRHQPLPFHPNARPAAEAAEAARQQGKFWEMHDRLFANQQSLSPALYESSARELGLDLTRFRQSLLAHAGTARIDEDQRLASSVGATGTPTLFINCRKVQGAVPYETLKPIVEEEMRHADALARQGKSGAALYQALCDENVRKYAGGESAAAARPAEKVAVPLRTDDPIQGKAKAPVTVVIFSDFQCPFCGRAVPAVKAIESAYPNEVRVAFKHFPLPFHPNAMPAALAAEAARAQGGAAKFWAMHDKLFGNQQALSDSTYEQYARELGLNLTRFRQDLADPQLRARVEQDTALAQKVGVNGTPTFVVNGERVVGSDGLRAAVDKQLALARAGR
ncbi:MAG TPA: thioredoxin domain-containing protein [Anaeromyxobacteraceae bacterium]|nr:thioredoxin domain-containing protein [Anaeromyxobacteraceae bacterium]